MDKMMVKVIEGIWTGQKRLPQIFDISNSLIVKVIFMALHLTLLAVIISLVTVRWVVQELWQKLNLKVSPEMDLTFSTN